MIDDFDDFERGWGRPSLLFSGCSGWARYLVFGVGLLCVGVVAILVWKVGPGSDKTYPPNPDEAYRQLLSTSQRWTCTQKIGVDCVLTICNQHVDLSLTLLTSELLEDIVRQELADSTYTQRELDRLLAQRKQQLRVDEHLVFLLTIKPGKQTAPLRSDMKIGSIQDNLSLHFLSGQVHHPTEWDFALNQALSAKSSTLSKGYVFFLNRDRSGETIVDLERDSSLSARLKINGGLRSDKKSVTWNFDLVAAHRPPPMQPTPTPDPNAPPPSDGIDWDTVIGIAEVLLLVFGPP